MSEVFCFGLGYSARRLAANLGREGHVVRGTSRTREGADRAGAAGVHGFHFDGTQPGEGVAACLNSATHVLVSIPPGTGGDPVLAHHAADIAASQSIAWIGYLSTVGVYGDRGGAWVDEETPPSPASERSRRRLAAEKAWLELASATGKRVHVFRLAGIYGPGRSAIDAVANSTARRIVKPGQVFNRIHVEDIANVLAAAMASSRATRTFNVADDEPAPPQDVVAFAAQLLGLAPPPLVAVEEANLSAMGQSFYEENKRVRNDRIKRELGVTLRYPTYREGLSAIARQEANR